MARVKRKTEAAPQQEVPIRSEAQPPLYEAKGSLANAQSLIRRAQQHLDHEEDIELAGRLHFQIEATRAQLGALADRIGKRKPEEEDDT